MHAHAVLTKTCTRSANTSASSSHAHAVWRPVQNRDSISALCRRARARYNNPCHVSRSLAASALGTPACQSVSVPRRSSVQGRSVLRAVGALLHDSEPDMHGGGPGWRAAAPSGAHCCHPRRSGRGAFCQRRRRRKSCLEPYAWPACRPGVNQQVPAMLCPALHDSQPCSFAWLMHTGTRC